MRDDLAPATSSTSTMGSPSAFTCATAGPPAWSANATGASFRSEAVRFAFPAGNAVSGSKSGAMSASSSQVRISWMGAPTSSIEALQWGLDEDAGARRVDQPKKRLFRCYREASEDDRLGCVNLGRSGAGQPLDGHLARRDLDAKPMSGAFWNEELRGDGRSVPLQDPDDPSYPLYLGERVPRFRKESRGLTSLPSQAPDRNVQTAIGKRGSGGKASGFDGAALPDSDAIDEAAELRAAEFAEGTCGMIRSAFARDEHRQRKEGCDGDPGEPKARSSGPLYGYAHRENAAIALPDLKQIAWKFTSRSGRRPEEDDGLRPYRPQRILSRPHRPSFRRCEQGRARRDGQGDSASAQDHPVSLASLFLLLG